MISSYRSMYVDAGIRRAHLNNSISNYHRPKIQKQEIAPPVTHILNEIHNYTTLLYIERPVAFLRSQKQCREPENGSRYVVLLLSLCVSWWIVYCRPVPP